MNTDKIFLWCKFALPCLLVLNLSCTSSFESYNTNQHEVDEETMTYDDLKVGSFFTQMQKNIVMFDEKSGDNGNLSSDYQVAQGLTSDLYSGYIAPTLGSGNMNTGSYYFISNWIEQSFTKPMKNVMNPWLSITKVTAEQQRTQVSALATIVKVEAMHRVADAYGPIPYVNFDGSAQNSYNALDEVYAKFFEELDAAIDILTEYVDGNPSSTILANYDIVYNGNATKWVKFANTLRLRLAMRVVYANPSLAQTQAEKSAKHPFGLIESSGDRAALQRSSNLVYYHPLYEIAYNFGRTDASSHGDCQPGATLDAYLNGYKDPRRSSYLTEATEGGYHGVRCGIPTSVWDKYRDRRYISSLNMDNSTTEIVWMTAAESYFLRAEGALRGWAMGGSAQSFYERGIAVSFEETKAGDAGAYITDQNSTPSEFADNAEGSNYNYPAPSDITIAWDVTAGFEKNLERIITQKWIAIYPDGPEAWAEFRRTGYPKIIPVVTNSSNGTIDTDIQVRRIPYPQSEYNTNREGVLVGVSKLGGQDNGGVKLWWDKK